jgi:hypothetical protein
MVPSISRDRARSKSSTRPHGASPSSAQELVMTHPPEEPCCAPGDSILIGGLNAAGFDLAVAGFAALWHGRGLSPEKLTPHHGASAVEVVATLLARGRAEVDVDGKLVGPSGRLSHGYDRSWFRLSRTAGHADRLLVLRPRDDVDLCRDCVEWFASQLGVTVSNNLSNERRRTHPFAYVRRRASGSDPDLYL